MGFVAEPSLAARPGPTIPPPGQAPHRVKCPTGSGPLAGSRVAGSSVGQGRMASCLGSARRAARSCDLISRLIIRARLSAAFHGASAPRVKPAGRLCPARTYARACHRATTRWAFRPRSTGGGAAANRPHGLPLRSGPSRPPGRSPVAGCCTGACPAIATIASGTAVVGGGPVIGIDLRSWMPKVSYPILHQTVVRRYPKPSRKATRGPKVRSAACPTRSCVPAERSAIAHAARRHGSLRWHWCAEPARVLPPARQGKTQMHADQKDARKGSASAAPTWTRVQSGAAVRRTSLTLRVDNP